MPRAGAGGYPRPVTSPTRAPRRPRTPASRTAETAPQPDDAAAPPDGSASPPAKAAAGRSTRRLGWDPDGGHGEIHDLLVAAVAEAARLLDADGAMVYLVDPATGHLRFAHDAGIRSRRSRAWVRSIDLPVGVGIFGQSVAERAVVRDRRLPHRCLVRPRTGHGSRGRRPRDPLDGRRAARRRRCRLRGAGHLLVARRRVQPCADRARPCAGRSRGRRDAQRAPDRGARRLTVRARQARRRRALAAARSGHGSAPPRTSRPSSSSPWTRLPGCSTPRAPGSS